MTPTPRLLQKSPAGLTIALAALIIGGVGCGTGDSAEREGATAATPELARARDKNLSREGFQVSGVDLNNDGEPDQWTLSRGGGPVRIERDMNFDGDVDMWQYPGEEGKLAEEEMDLDMDGVVDVVVYYEDGRLSRKEMSVDFEGVFSIVKFYDKSSKLLRVERDEDGDGDVDVWEYYEDDRRVRVGWDEDGDGQPDKFDTI